MDLVDFELLEQTYSNSRLQTRVKRSDISTSPHSTTITRLCVKGYVVFLIRFFTIHPCQ
jgi:hypothetical protein